MWKVTVFSYAVQWSFTAQIDKKENLNFIPSDFIGIQMQVKAVAISRINCGILRLVSVVHNAILAIFDISMDFHIVVGTEPSVQFILAVGTPQDGSVKGAAVGKTIRYTADVYGTSLAEIMRRHLHFLIPVSYTHLAHPVKERSRMEKPETEGGEKQRWSAADIQNFTEAVGDTNFIHRGEQAIVPGLLMLETMLLECEKQEMVWKEIKMRFYKPVFASQPVWTTREGMEITARTKEEDVCWKMWLS